MGEKKVSTRGSKKGGDLDVLENTKSQPAQVITKKSSRSKLVSSTTSSSTASPVVKTSPNHVTFNDYKTDAHSITGNITLGIITILAFLTRFWFIHHPDEVVFDEVHFGKFMSYYLEKTYFFDVHPPFGKLLYYFVGKLIGYNGAFKFENIGDNYIENAVPYTYLRAFPATLGALTVPLVFLIMRTSGYTLIACTVAASFVLFDNAQIAQTRLILLDATLIFSYACALYAYIRFYKLRKEEYSTKWWTWLTLTGVALSCIMSTKYIGLFAYITIGIAVFIDLWELLDIKRGLTIQQFSKHFVARAICLGIIPYLIYLFWFVVHFSVLTHSGPGDDFMSPTFQETLVGNVMTLEATPIRYYDVLTIRHRETKAYLHSHLDRYPLRYDDGRISSQGQQVTGYPHNDTNNYWIIKPANQFDEDDDENQIVRNGDIVKLMHVGTESDLLTHDVASPFYPTNEEFTTVPLADSNGERHNDTLFQIRMEAVPAGEPFKTRASYFKLIHDATKVAMWSHSKPLPEWGFGHQEINGNKNIAQTGNLWFVEDILDLPEEAKKDIKKLSFFWKYLELQQAMFIHNNALTSSHPYASIPVQWPFLLRGVSFWTKDDTREQIYFLGNPVGWWLTTAFLAVFTGIIMADQISRRRGLDPLEDHIRSRLYNSTGFFVIAWLVHYLPFYLMGRQLFLHHYLPAHLSAALVAGAMVQFMFAKVEEPATNGGSKRKVRLSGYAQEQVPKSAWISAGTIMFGVFITFVFFAPITYGTPGLDVQGVLARKWLDTWDYHFAK